MGAPGGPSFSPDYSKLGLSFIYKFNEISNEINEINNKDEKSVDEMIKSIQNQIASLRKNISDVPGNQRFVTKYLKDLEEIEKRFKDLIPKK